MVRFGCIVICYAFGKLFPHHVETESSIFGFVWIAGDLFSNSPLTVLFIYVVLIGWNGISSSFSDFSYLFVDK